MKKTLVITNKQTGKQDMFDMAYVKSYPTEESVKGMKAHKDHASFYMVIEFTKEMPYSIAMYGVDDYDLEVR